MKDPCVFLYLKYPLMKTEDFLNFFLQSPKSEIVFWKLVDPYLSHSSSHFDQVDTNTDSSPGDFYRCHQTDRCLLEDTHSNL